MKRNLFLLPVILAMIITGCTSTGAFVASNQTNVVLNEANYEIAAAGVTGEANSSYVLGFSYSSFGMVANTFALVRVSGSGMLYQEALENLWSSFEQEYGNVEGRTLALANVRYDTDIVNLIFYTKVKVSVRADVVEFSE